MLSIKKFTEHLKLRELYFNMLTFPSEKEEDGNSDKYEEENTTNHTSHYRTSI